MCCNLWPLFVALLPASSNAPNKPVDRISKSSSSHTRKKHCNCLNLFPQPTSTYQISSIALHRATLPPPFTALSMWLDGMSRCLIHKRGCVGDHQHTTPKDLRQQEKNTIKSAKICMSRELVWSFSTGKKRGATQTLEIFLVPQFRKRSARNNFWHLSFVSAPLYRKNSVLKQSRCARVSIWCKQFTKQPSSKHP